MAQQCNYRWQDSPGVIRERIDQQLRNFPSLKGALTKGELQAVDMFISDSSSTSISKFHLSRALKKLGISTNRPISYLLGMAATEMAA